MAHRKLDRVAGTTTSTGTGALTLSSTAVTGFSRFQDMMADGDTAHVMVVDRTTGNYQGGLYTYSAGTLTLTTLLSSTTGSQINFGAGTKDLFDYAPASKAIVEDNNGDVSVTRDFTVGRNGTVAGTLGVTGAATISGGLLQVLMGSRLIRVQQSAGINRIDSYDNPVTQVVELDINGNPLVVNVADVELARFSASGTFLRTWVGATIANVITLRDDNGGAAAKSLIAFDVSSPLAGEVNVAKAGIGLDRNNLQGVGDLVFFNRNNTDTANFTLSDEVLRIQATGGHVLPGADNVQNLGSGSKRYATVYAGTGTINTSDESDKTNIRVLTDAETAVAVALASKVQLWQWKDAIAKKGVDAARLHVSLTAQVVRDTFIAGGLEPFRYGCVGFDALTKTESYTETVQRPKTQTVDAQEQSVEIVNGVPTLVTKTVQRSQPVGAMVPVVDGAGQAVTVQTGTDADGRPIMGPMLHFVPEMESVDETLTRTVPDLDANGEPVLRMNVRPDQLAMWIAHGLAHRLAALEAKVG
jgi:hypothetical protein